MPFTSILSACDASGVKTSVITFAAALAGGRPFRVFSLDEHSRVNDTTMASRRGVTAVAFAGARPFPFLEGSGFCSFSFMSKNLIRRYGRGDLHFNLSAGSK